MEPLICHGSLSSTENVSCLMKITCRPIFSISELQIEYRMKNCVVLQEEEFERCRFTKVAVHNKLGRGIIIQIAVWMQGRHLKEAGPFPPDC